MGDELVWVTGAAGGIGRAVVDALTPQCKVLATDIHEPVIDAANVYTMACDVRDPEAVDGVVARAAQIGTLTGHVNCAAIMRRVEVLDITPEIWDEVFDVNIKAAFFCAQAAARAMIAAGTAGCLVQICSLGAHIPRSNIVAYGASKGAVDSLVAGLAVGLAPHKIRSVGVMPGTIDTPMGADRWAVPGARAAAEAKVPLGRLGAPDEIASLVRFVLSPAASYLTGSVLRADGGRLIAG